MRSETNQIKSVAFNFLQRKNQTGCRHCYDTVMGGKGRTVLDDSGTLAITAWICARCGRVIEEVRLLVEDGKAEPRPIRYAVAPSHWTGRPTLGAHRAFKN